MQINSPCNRLGCVWTEQIDKIVVLGQVWIQTLPSFRNLQGDLAVLLARSLPSQLEFGIMCCILATSTYRDRPTCNADIQLRGALGEVLGRRLGLELNVGLRVTGSLEVASRYFLVMLLNCTGAASFNAYARGFSASLFSLGLFSVGCGASMPR